MAELLETEGQAFEQLHRGDVSEGKIVGKAGDTLIVDVGAKAEGLVPSNEMHSLPADQRAALNARLDVITDPDLKAALSSLGESIITKP